MANDCFYEMHVFGDENNIDKFVKYMKSGYSYYTDDEVDKDYPWIEPDKYKLHFKEGNLHLDCDAEKHLYRVFSAEVDEEASGDGYAYISGDCAWSVYCSMMEGEHTYYSQVDKFEPLKKKHATSLIQCSKELGLKIEVTSEEWGMMFTEHYLIDNGEVLIDEESELEDPFKEELPC